MQFSVKKTKHRSLYNNPALFQSRIAEKSWKENHRVPAEENGDIPMQRNTPVVPCMKSPLPERKEHGTPRPQIPRQVRVTCTLANRVCRLYKIAWCRCIASAAIQLRKLVVRSTKSPAGAVQTALWRELDLSSSRAPAESPVVIRCARRLSELRSSSVSGGTADGGKNMRAARPHTPWQVRITCTPANRVCRLYKYSMVQVLCICRSPAE